MKKAETKIQNNSKGGKSFIVQKSDSGFLGVQAKLKVGKPDDKYEQEADRVADTVMRKKSAEKSFFPPSPASGVQTKPIAQGITPLVQLAEDEEAQTKLLIQKEEEEEAAQAKLEIQREEEEEAVQPKTKIQCAEEEEMAQTQPMEEEEEMLQPKGEQSVASSESVSSQMLQNSKGNGSALASGVKAEMEQGFGADFSKVKVHTNQQAVQMSKSLGAQAFTTGNDIFFNEGKYKPGSEKGKRLLAHELTHTVQQGASTASSTIQTKKERRNPDYIMNVAGNLFATKGVTAKAIESELGKNKESNKKEGKYKTISYDKEYSNYLISEYFPSQESAAKDKEDSIWPWTGVHVMHKKEWLKLAKMFSKAQGRIAEDQVKTIQLENLYNSWVPFANFTDSSFEYAHGLAKSLGMVDNGDIILPEITDDEIGHIKDSYQRDKVEMPFSQSTLSSKLELLKANGQEVSSARHKLQSLYAQKTIDRLTTEIGPSLLQLAQITKNISDLKMIGGYLDKIAAFAMGGFNMPTIIGAGIGGMAADTIGYFMYNDEKKKLTKKINQFKGAVSGLKQVAKMNNYEAIIQRFHAALNKRYQIIGEIYTTINERREAFQNMGEKLDANAREKGNVGVEKDSEHYTPEMTLIAAFREVGTMAQKALDSGYIPQIKSQCSGLKSFLVQSRRYSRGIYGNCYWKYKYRINSTYHSENSIMQDALENVKSFEQKKELYLALINYEKLIQGRLMKVTNKYNSKNVAY